MAWVYLDDQFPDHPKVVLAGGDAAWLFVCGLAYSRRHELSGRIPRPQVPRLTDRKKPEKLADRLVAVGLWESLDDDFFLIHDYDEWNRPEESRKAAGRKAAKARWDNERKAKADADAMRTHPNGNAETPADGCPTPPPYPSPSVDTSSSSTHVLVAEPADEEEISQQVWELLAKHDADEYTRSGGVIRSRKWFVAAAETRRMACENLLAELRFEHTDWTPEQLAEALAKPATTASQGAPPDEAQRAALARMEEGSRRAQGDVCARCEGSGWVWESDDPSTPPEPCDCKRVDSSLRSAS